MFLLGDTRSEFAPQTGMDGRGGQKIQLESVKETKKRNSFCLIVVKRKGARCHFSFKPMGPTLPDVLIPLELAISACQKKRCPARFAWSRKRNSYKIVQKQSACLIMFAWFSLFVFPCLCSESMFDANTTCSPHGKVDLEMNCFFHTPFSAAKIPWSTFAAAVHLLLASCHVDV